MDQAVLEGLQEILYYYDLYEKGDEDGYLALHELTKCLQKTNRERNFYAFLFRILQIIQKIKVTIINSELKQDPSYQELMGFCESDLEYYHEVAVYLSEYMRYCLAEDDFSHLSDAFLITVKLSTILNNIASYYSHINSLLTTSLSGISYQYPATVYEQKEETHREIELLKKNLVMNRTQD